FPSDTGGILEKYSEESFSDYILCERTKDALFKLTRSFYLGSINQTFVDSIANEYEINNELFYSTKEEALHSITVEKNIAFKKDIEDMITILDDYIELNNQLSPESFSKELLESIID